MTMEGCGCTCITTYSFPPPLCTIVLTLAVIHQWTVQLLPKVPELSSSALENPFRWTWLCPRRVMTMEGFVCLLSCISIPLPLTSSDGFSNYIAFSCLQPADAVILGDDGGVWLYLNYHVFLLSSFMHNRPNLSSDTPMNNPAPARGT